jgi:flagellar biosynthetic protein FliR
MVHPDRMGLIASFAQMFVSALAMALPVVLLLLLVQSPSVLALGAQPQHLALGLPLGVLAASPRWIASAPLLDDA